MLFFCFHSKNTVVNRATTCLFPFLSSFKSAFTVMKAQCSVCRDCFDELDNILGKEGKRKSEQKKKFQRTFSTSGTCSQCFC